MIDSYVKPPMSKSQNDQALAIRALGTSKARFVAQEADLRTHDVERQGRRRTKPPGTGADLCVYSYGFAHTDQFHALIQSYVYRGTRQAGARALSVSSLCSYDKVQSNYLLFQRHITLSRKQRNYNRKQLPRHE